MKELTISRVYFAVASIISMTAFVIAGTIFFNTPGVDVQDTGKIFLENCQNELRAVGFTPQTEGKNISIHQAASDNLEEAIVKSTIAAGRCLNYEIKTFCAGIGCEKSGLSFSLAPKQ